MRRKLLTVFLIIAALTMLFAITSTAAAVVETWDVSNTENDNVIAYLYADEANEGMYTLTITGTGYMESWMYNRAPWYSCKQKISSVIIENEVTSIGVGAFIGCSSLTSVVIPDSVTSIGSTAFGVCSSLTSVVIPDSVTSIGVGAFEGCSSLTSIVIPNSVTSIDRSAFYDCSSLTSILIPNNVTSIGDYAFEGCSYLTVYCELENQPSGWSLDWNYSNCPVVWGHTHTYENRVCVCGLEKPYVEKWDVSATENDNVLAYLEADESNEEMYTLTITGTGNMKDWTNRNTPWYSSYREKITSATIEDDVTNVGSYAFSNCDLTSVVIPNSVTSIGSRAFYWCSYLTNIEVEANNEYYCSIDGNLYTKDTKTLVQYAIGKMDTEFTIPDSVTIIGDNAFYPCDSLTNVVIPNSITTIGNEAFRDCGLTSVVIPDSVTTICESAFEDCDFLTSIIIPDSVTLICVRAFGMCNSLKNIEVDANNEYYCSIDGNLYTKDTKTLVQYAIGKTDTQFTVPDNVTTIGGFAFNFSNFLTSVVIHDNVSTVGFYAFGWCKPSLKIYCESENQPSGWSLDWNYSNCPIVWGHTHTYENRVCVCGLEKPYVEKWDVSATENDNVLAYLEADESNEGKYTLTITGTGNMKDWTEDRNTSWYGIISVTIEDGVTNVGSYAFSHCTYLTSVVIPNSITSIGSRAFYNCRSLTNVVIPNSVTTIGSYAFSICRSLRNVVIPNSVTLIGDYAFDGCYYLTIYCESESQPSGWDLDWNVLNRPVIWNYKTAMLEDMFVFNGYSVREDGTGSICVSYTINYDVIKEYESLIGETLDFGVVFASYERLNGKQPLNSDGTLTSLENGKVIKQSLVDFEYTTYDFVLRDIGDSIKDHSFVISLYVFNGSEVKYNQGSFSETVSGISYNQISQGEQK